MQPSTAKAKGRQTENQLVEWIRSQGYEAERRRLNGSKDLGDISVHGLPLVIEVKSGAGPWKMTEWVRQTEAEIKNAEVDVGLLAIRPARATSVDTWVGVILPENGLDTLEREDTVFLSQTLCSWSTVRDLTQRNPFHEFGMWYGKRMLTVASLPTAWALAEVAVGA